MEENKLRNEIILIGPMGVGKTYTAGLLSDKLNKPHIRIDEIRFKYYEEIGYDRKTEEAIGKEKGFFNGVYRYWKPFELYAINKILTEYSDCVFDFGAGHSVYEDEGMFNESKSILSEFENIILLLPSGDIEESVEFLKERNGINDNEGMGMLRHFITHHSNYDLCRHIVYVKNKSKEDIVNEICIVTNNGTVNLE